MHFGLLGPLLAVDDVGNQITITGVRQKALLACLLVRANTPVSFDELIDAVWDGQRPAGSVTMLRSVVMRLRQGLGPDLAARIVAHPPGYLIRVDAAELDLLRFEALCRDTATALRAGAWAEASDAAAEALALWRGEPLLDVSVHRLRAQVSTRYEQLRLQALEDQAAADLNLGRHEHLVQQLRDLAAAYPLRERFHAQLMLALARCGRRAEALEVYQNARRLLVEQLGVEPGPELREVQQSVLAGQVEPAGVTPDAESDSDSAGIVPPRQIPVPQQLPAAPAWFTGREPELAALTQTVHTVPDYEAPAGRTVVISAIAGAGGIGKTWLALYWAHQHVDQFPDGQLFIDLHGFAPVGQPVSPHAAVRGFLDGVGVGAERIPVELDAQIALYRSCLADKRMLIVLDNAADTAQVTPLLPGSPTCTVLVTSRRYLSSLVTGHNAHHLRLDVLTKAQAHHLLTARLGAQRMAAEPDAIQTLLACCAGFPLALGIVIGRALAHPQFPLSALAAELDDDTTALGALDDADAAASLPAVLSWSVRALTDEQARMFGLLGLAPGPDISLPAAASLAALSTTRVRAVLRELEHASLVAQHAPGRYRMHDLIRLYATDIAHHNVAQDVQEAALRRVVDFYTHTADSANRLLNPHRPPIRLAPSAPGVHHHPLSDASAALAWFDTEHPALLATQHTATRNAWHRTAWQLAWTLNTFHTRRGHRHEQVVVWQAALHAAEYLPDPTLRTVAHRLLGHAYAALGRSEEGIGHLHQALALAQDHDDPDQEAHTRLRLALAWEQQGNDRQALQHAIRALDLYRALDQSVWEAAALNMIGWYAARLGEYDTARTHCQAALALHRRHHTPDGEAATLDSLGYLEHHSGHHHQAIDYYRQALTQYGALGNATEAANTLDRLGHPHVALGEHEQARVAWREALRLYQEQDRDTDADRVQQQLDALDQRPMDPRRAASSPGPG